MAVVKLSCAFFVDRFCTYLQFWGFRVKLAFQGFLSPKLNFSNFLKRFLAFCKYFLTWSKIRHQLFRNFSFYSIATWGFRKIILLTSVLDSASLKMSAHCRRGALHQLRLKVGAHTAGGFGCIRAKHSTDIALAAYFSIGALALTLVCASTSAKRKRSGAKNCRMLSGTEWQRCDAMCPAAMSSNAMRPVCDALTLRVRFFVSFHRYHLNKKSLLWVKIWDSKNFLLDRSNRKFLEWKLLYDLENLHFCTFYAWVKMFCDSVAVYRSNGELSGWIYDGHDSQVNRLWAGEAIWSACESVGRFVRLRIAKMVSFWV